MDNVFVEVEANKQSMSMRRPLYGVGINDSNYIVGLKLGGNRVWCKYYIVWKNMMERCYSKGYQKRNPTYVGCSVSSEWLTFSNFKAWMETQDWKGKQLDKDLLVLGNKIYSPENCLFVSSQINSLLTDSAAVRGKYPQGVCFDKKAGKYKASCKVGGKAKNLGSFNEVRDAEVAYLTFKSELISKIAQEFESLEDSRLKGALLERAELFKYQTMTRG